jgi:rRNA maturation endonuclease Nob1
MIAVTAMESMLESILQTYRFAESCSQCTSRQQHPSVFTATLSYLSINVSNFSTTFQVNEVRHDEVCFICKKVARVRKPFSQ